VTLFLYKKSNKNQKTNHVTGASSLISPLSSREMYVTTLLTRSASSNACNFKESETESGKARLKGRLRPHSSDAIRTENNLLDRTVLVQHLG